MKRVLVCDAGVMAEPSHVHVGRLGQGFPKAKPVSGAPWPDGAIAVPIGVRADISFAFACVLRLPKMEVAVEAVEAVEALCPVEDVEAVEAVVGCLE